MKSLLRNILIYSGALFLLSELVQGVTIIGGILSYLISGAVLSVMFIIVKPILNIVSLPFNILTLGLFSFFSNIIILFLLTLVVPYIQIKPFTFYGYSYGGFIIPKMDFNLVFAYIVSGLILSAIITVLTWLIKK